LLLQNAIEIDPNYALAHLELGHRLLTDHIPEDEYHLRKAIELAPFDGWTHIYLGNLLWGSQDFNSAEGAFRKAIEVWPDRSVPYWCLAYFLERQGQNEEARKLYEKALELDPADAEANWRFGSYLKDVGDLEGAKSYLLQAVYLNPSHKDAAAMLARIDNQLSPLQSKNR
jgi:Tfp pilus assembly protein PilF